MAQRDDGGDGIRFGNGGEGTAVGAVGLCPSCGVAFVGQPEEASAVTHLLGVHAAICPGGNRLGDVVRPLASEPGVVPG